MSDERLIRRFLPLTEATYLIMLALTERLHGYGIMQKTESMSGGRVKLGPGTLYGALGKLDRDGLITMTLAEDRRKCYELTDDGRVVLYHEILRLRELAENGVPKLEKLRGKAE